MKQWPKGAAPLAFLGCLTVRCEPASKKVILLGIFWWPGFSSENSIAGDFNRSLGPPSIAAFFLGWFLCFSWVGSFGQIQDEADLSLRFIKRAKAAEAFETGHFAAPFRPGCFPTRVLKLQGSFKQIFPSLHIEVFWLEGLAHSKITTGGFPRVFKVFS